MPGKLFSLVMALVLVIGAAVPAQAHRLNIFATPIGSSVEGRVYFVGGSVAGNAEVVLLNAAGEPVAETVSDPADGTFALAVPYRADFTVSADLRDGHVATFPILAARLSESLPAAPAEGGAPAGDQPEDAAPADAGSPAAAIPTDALESAIARQIAPIAQQIDEMEATIRIRDFIGGIGFILGIFGIWALLRTRRVIAAKEPA